MISVHNLLTVVVVTAVASLLPLTAVNHTTTNTAIITPFDVRDADVTGSTLAVMVREKASTFTPDQLPTVDWHTAKADNNVEDLKQYFPPNDPTGRLGWFGSSWSYDTNENGCNTRNDMLKRDLTNLTFEADSCTVTSGELLDPYTGQKVTFRRTLKTSKDVQIDHVVPLSYAYAHGAHKWPADMRLKFANNPTNLIVTTEKANSAKSNSGPASASIGSTRNHDYDPIGGEGWIPPNKNYQQDYLVRFAYILIAYDLVITPAEAEVITNGVMSWPGHFTITMGYQAFGLARTSDTIGANVSDGTQQNTTPNKSTTIDQSIESAIYRESFWVIICIILTLCFTPIGAYTIAKYNRKRTHRDN